MKLERTEFSSCRLINIPNDMFDKPGVADEILGPMPVPEGKPRVPRAPSGLPPYLASFV